MIRHVFLPAFVIGALIQAGVGMLVGRAESAPQANNTIVVSEGLQGPEAALYDPQTDTYLVSNISGDPTGKDDNGFISKISPDGKVTSLKWIDGAAGDVTLHAPKGMVFRNNILLVADIDTIRLFDRNTGKPGGAWPIPNSTFLNDLAVGSDGSVYVTDTAISLAGGQPKPQGTAAIHRLDSNQKDPETFSSGEALSGPNGIVATPEGPVVVTFLSNKVLRVKAKGAAPETIATLPAGQLDGIARLSDGSYVVSSWAAQAVLRVSADGQSRRLVGGLTSPASIDVDEKRRRVLVPELTENTLFIAPLD
jgi:sugar lactone lactonase YvrE